MSLAGKIIRVAVAEAIKVHPDESPDSVLRSIRVGLCEAAMSAARIDGKKFEVWLGKQKEQTERGGSVP